MMRKIFLTAFVLALLLGLAPVAHAGFVFYQDLDNDGLNDLLQTREVTADYNVLIEAHLFGTDPHVWTSTVTNDTATAYQHSYIGPTLLSGVLSVCNPDEMPIEVSSIYIANFLVDDPQGLEVTFSGDAGWTCYLQDSDWDLVHSGETLWTDTLDPGTYSLWVTAGADYEPFQTTTFSLAVGSEPSSTPPGDAPVPEPVSMVMLGCLGGGMVAVRKLRRKK
jgi:hypothetical protein